MPAVAGRPVLVRRRRVALVCIVCEQEYETHAYRATTSKYCSKDCWSRRAPRALCEGCGTVFTVVPADRTRYCSRPCAHAHMVGARAPRWKDGQSLDRERSRLSGALARWRREVFKRDGYRCVRCGEGGYLHAHHIASFADHPALRLEVSNGETLCVPCHSAEHGRDLGRGRTIRAAEPSLGDG